MRKLKVPIEKRSSHPTPPSGKSTEKPEVKIVRDWKEYLGESFLIVFSVVLALVLTEWVNKANERQQTKEIINQVKEELIHNKQEEIGQYNYHQQVLRTIDSALADPKFANRIMNNNEFHLELLAPQGILHGDLEDVAWQLARSHNLSSTLDIPTLTLLTSIYNDQQRIIKVEDEIGKLLLGPDSRKTENLRLTFILIRDNFRGWATYRVPDLLKKYDYAIATLNRL
ncbi:MAG: hypothetical protein ACXVBF_10110 [Flavisolibacter sp.]